MENDSKLRQLWSGFSDKIAEQLWFQELKSKWEELDPQSRSYLKAAGGIGGTLILFIVILSSMWSVHKLKSELTEKNELLSTIQSANDELRKLRESNSGGREGEDNSAPWSGYLQNLGQNAGIDPASLDIAAEKPVGASTEKPAKGSAPAEPLAKESLIDVNLKHVSIKQVVKYAFFAENGTRPMKLRNLAINTKNDPAGYMDATLTLSAFTLKQENH